MENIQSTHFSSTTDSAFTKAGLDALRKLAGADNGEALRCILRVYQMNLEKLVQDISLARSQADWRAVKNAAHSLKGASFNVGAIKLGNICKGLESFAALSSSEQVIHTCDLLDSEVQKVRLELRLLLSGE